MHCALAQIISMKLHLSAQTQPTGSPQLTPRQKRLARQHKKHAEQLDQRRQQNPLREQQQQQQQQEVLPPLPPSSWPAADAGTLRLDCPHFASCSGCTLDAGLDRPPLLGAAHHFFEAECGFPSFQLNAGPAQRWRHRARLAVRQGSDGCSAVVGLFAEGSHTITAIPSCVVHNPSINAAVELLQAAIADCGIQAYDESSGRGELRYVQLTVVPQAEEHAGTHNSASHTNGAAAVQLALVWNAAAKDAAKGTSGGRRLEALADCLWQRAQQQGRPQSSADAAPARPLLHSVWANFQPARTNAILGHQWRLLRGDREAWLRLGGADICFGPGSFLQANPAAMEQALAAMQRHVPSGSTITDLHAGVGTIGLSLAASCHPRWVRFVEISEQGLRPFQRSAARLQQHAGEPAAGLAAGLAAGSDSSSSSSSSRVSSEGKTAGVPSEAAPEAAAPQLYYHVAAAGSDPGRWCRGAEVVVVDPPRKGLEPSLLSWLCSPGTAGAEGVRRLLYLSCGFPALRRDCAALLGSGQWRLAHAEAFLFFPGADHIETLCVFDAVGAQPEPAE